MKDINPFLISGYSGPEFFCDREKETKRLKEASLNGLNMTLFSPRRLGKTGLINHLFYVLRKEKINTVYIDVSGTENFNGFIVQFTNAVLKLGSPSKNILLTRALELFGKIRPTLTLNDLTGMPEISFHLESEKEQQSTLQEVFELLEKQKQRNLIAIDEFQQINLYPEKNTEQILRKYIQLLKNSNFIFSGSQRHLLLPMFTDAKRPFYQSTGFLALEKLEHDKYKDFIINQFKKVNQGIDEKAVNFILDWTQSYTFYTQYFCNRLYAKNYKSITEKILKGTILEIFAERETIYYNYKKLLSGQQYKLMTAIAIENAIREPTHQAFIKKHDLGNASTVRKSLQALVEKEIIYETLTEEKSIFRVYDVFLSRWLQWNNRS